MNEALIMRIVKDLFGNNLFFWSGLKSNFNNQLVENKDNQNSNQLVNWVKNA